MLLIGEVRAPPTFSQFVYSKEQVQNATATITHPNGIDTVMALVDTTGLPGGYWGRTIPASWNLQLNDSVKVKIKTIVGDSALTFRKVTNVTGDNLIWPFVFPGPYTLSVKNVVENGADSADAIIFKKGIGDTLKSRFVINDNYFYEIYFDGFLLSLINGDSVVIEARAPGKGGFTKGEVQHRFIDADTLPSFPLNNLDLGVIGIIAPDTADSGTIFTPKVVVKNYGTLKETPKVYFRVNAFYLDSLKKVINPNISDTFAFKPCTLSQVGNWIAKCSLSYKYDINQTNDILSKSIYVQGVGINENLENKIAKLSKIVTGSNFGNCFKLNQEGNIYLYNVLGREVYRTQGNKIDTKNLPSGIYYLFLKPEDSEELILGPEKIILTK